MENSKINVVDTNTIHDLSNKNKYLVEVLWQINAVLLGKNVQLDVIYQKQHY